MRASWCLLTTAGLLAAAGCVAIADIDHIEFETGTTSTGSGGGSTASCTDGVQNGQETGLDCGGPDCPPCDEDCTNGTDDNGDDLVDCADPICAGYHCVPPSPDDAWSGPVAFYFGTEAATVTCGPAWAEQTSAYGGTLEARPADCNDCGCGEPGGGECEGPVLDLWIGDSCAGSMAHRELFANGADACHDLGTGSYGSARVSAILAYGGSCTPSGGGVSSLPEATWSHQAVICGLPVQGGGCEEGTQICVRRPPSPFRPTVCVSQAGEHPCPAGPYSEHRVLYGSIDDKRGCTACQCGMAQGQTCDGSVFVYANETCTEDEFELPAVLQCVGHSGIRSARFVITNEEPFGGSCPTSGGEPTGAATAADPLTLCCLPP